MPYHWGKKGLVKGDSANDLLGLALDPNVHIGEYKVATCDIRPGRRPRGPALAGFVEGYRRRVGSARVGGFADRLDENGGGGA
jgi:formate dehydrogenase major subunit